MEDAVPSKTKRKQQMHALQELGAQLVGLSPERLASMRLPENLSAAVHEARRIASHEGRRRQMQYIGKLMRVLDAEPIRERLAHWTGQSREQAARHQLLERWRKRLLADDGLLTEYARDHPGADLQALRALIRNARKESVENRPPRAFHELFRILRQAEDNKP